MQATPAGVISTSRTNSAALRSFTAVRATLKPDEQPDVDLLVGLSLAQWLNQQQESAIASYQENDKQRIPPVRRRS